MMQPSDSASSCNQHESPRDAEEDREEAQGTSATSPAAACGQGGGEHVHVVINIKAPEDEQQVAKQLADSDLAARMAQYERDLLAHQLQAVSQENAALQTQVRTLQQVQQRLAATLLAAQHEAASQRRQAAEATAAADAAGLRADAAAGQQRQTAQLLRAIQQQVQRQRRTSSSYESPVSPTRSSAGRTLSFGPSGAKLPASPSAGLFSPPPAGVGPAARRRDQQQQQQQQSGRALPGADRRGKLAGTSSGAADYEDGSSSGLSDVMAGLFDDEGMEGEARVRSNGSVTSRHAYTAIPDPSATASMAAHLTTPPASPAAHRPAWAVPHTGGSEAVIASAPGLRATASATRPQVDARARADSSGSWPGMLTMLPPVYGIDPERHAAAVDTLNATLQAEQPQPDTQPQPAGAGPAAGAPTSPRAWSQQAVRGWDEGRGSSGSTGMNGEVGAPDREVLDVTTSNADERQQQLQQQQAADTPAASFATAATSATELALAITSAGSTPFLTPLQEAAAGAADDGAMDGASELLCMEVLSAGSRHVMRTVSFSGVHTPTTPAGSYPTTPFSTAVCAFAPDEGWLPAVAGNEGAIIPRPRREGESGGASPAPAAEDAGSVRQQLIQLSSCSQHVAMCHYRSPSSQRLVSTSGVRTRADSRVGPSYPSSPSLPSSWQQTHGTLLDRYAATPPSSTGAAHVAQLTAAQRAALLGPDERVPGGGGGGGHDTPSALTTFRSETPPSATKSTAAVPRSPQPAPRRDTAPDLTAVPRSPQPAPRRETAPDLTARLTSLISLGSPPSDHAALRTTSQAQQQQQRPHLLPHIKSTPVITSPPGAGKDLTDLLPPGPPLVRRRPAKASAAALAAGGAVRSVASGPAQQASTPPLGSGSRQPLTPRGSTATGLPPLSPPPALPGAAYSPSRPTFADRYGLVHASLVGEDRADHVAHHMGGAEGGGSTSTWVGSGSFVSPRGSVHLPPGEMAAGRQGLLRWAEEGRGSATGLGSAAGMSPAPGGRVGPVGDGKGLLLGGRGSVSSTALGSAAQGSAVATPRTHRTVSMYSPMGGTTIHSGHQTPGLLSPSGLPGAASRATLPLGSGRSTHASTPHLQQAGSGAATAAGMHHVPSSGGLMHAVGSHGGGAGHSRLDESLHLLQALEAITRGRRAEIDAQLGHVEHSTATSEASDDEVGAAVEEVEEALRRSGGVWREEEEEEEEETGQQERGQQERQEGGRGGYSQEQGGAAAGSQASMVARHSQEQASMVARHSQEQAWRAPSYNQEQARRAAPYSQEPATRAAPYSQEQASRAAPPSHEQPTRTTPYSQDSNKENRAPRDPTTVHDSSGRGPRIMEAQGVSAEEEEATHQLPGQWDSGERTLSLEVAALDQDQEDHERGNLPEPPSTGASAPTPPLAPAATLTLPAAIGADRSGAGAGGAQPPASRSTSLSLPPPDVGDTHPAPTTPHVGVTAALPATPHKQPQWSRADLVNDAPPATPTAAAAPASYPPPAVYPSAVEEAGRDVTVHHGREQQQQLQLQQQTQAGRPPWPTQHHHLAPTPGRGTGEQQPGETSSLLLDEHLQQRHQQQQQVMRSATAGGSAGDVQVPAGYQGRVEYPYPRQQQLAGSAGAPGMAVTPPAATLGTASNSPGGDAAGAVDTAGQAAADAAAQAQRTGSHTEGVTGVSDDSTPPRSASPIGFSFDQHVGAAASTPSSPGYAFPAFAAAAPDDEYYHNHTGSSASADNTHAPAQSSRERSRPPATVLPASDVQAAINGQQSQQDTEPEQAPTPSSYVTPIAGVVTHMPPPPPPQKQPAWPPQPHAATAARPDATMVTPTVSIRAPSFSFGLAAPGGGGTIADFAPHLATTPEAYGSPDEPDMTHVTHMASTATDRDGQYRGQPGDVDAPDSASAHSTGSTALFTPASHFPAASATPPSALAPPTGSMEFPPGALPPALPTPFAHYPPPMSPPAAPAAPSAPPLPPPVTSSALVTPTSHMFNARLHTPSHPLSDLSFDPYDASSNPSSAASPAVQASSKLGGAPPGPANALSAAGAAAGTAGAVAAGTLASSAANSSSAAMGAAAAVLPPPAVGLPAAHGPSPAAHGPSPAAHGPSGPASLASSCCSTLSYADNLSPAATTTTITTTGTTPSGSSALPSDVSHGSTATPSSISPHGPQLTTTSGHGSPPASQPSEGGGHHLPPHLTPPSLSSRAGAHWAGSKAGAARVGPVTSGPAMLPGGQQGVAAPDAATVGVMQQLAGTVADMRDMLVETLSQVRSTQHQVAQLQAQHEDVVRRMDRLEAPPPPGRD